MTKRLLVTISILLVIAGVGFAQGPWFKPFMQKATEPIIVDGILNEWNYCFPIDCNQNNIPENSRCRDWFPKSNEDLSGYIKLMWDDEYLYFAADIMDDVPGTYPAPGWRADAIEFYMGNYDVGDVPWSQNEPGGYHDTPDGKYAVQLGCYYDANADSFEIYQWNPVGRSIKSENTTMVGVLWEEEDGYTIEGKILWDDFKSDLTGNIFALNCGDVIPFTFAMYDVDELIEYDFDGYQFAERTSPPWQGPGRGWQVLEVKCERQGPFYEFSYPYIKKAKVPVTIDGVMDEWSFCYPVDMNQSAMPEGSRCRAWFPKSNEDLSGYSNWMYDEEYLYFAAKVMDDVPGTLPAPGWRADALEIYIGNYDVGGMLGKPAHTGYKNANDSLDVQLGFYYDANADSIEMWMWNPIGGSIKSENTTMAGLLWEEEDGYYVEGKVSLAEIAAKVDPENNTRTYDFVGHIGSFFPCTFSIYDVDELIEYDFDGYQFATPEGPPWMGPGGGGWYGIEVVGTCLWEEMDWLWANYTGVDSKNAGTIPTSFNLRQNYPNPFNPTTTIEFDLVSAGNVSLYVYNVKGEVVQKVIDNEYRTIGTYKTTVDLTNLPTGIYFSVLEQGSQKMTSKMMLMK